MIFRKELIPVLDQQINRQTYSLLAEFQPLREEQSIVAHQLIVRGALDLVILQRNSFRLHFLDVLQPLIRRDREIDQVANRPQIQSQMQCVIPLREQRFQRKELDDGIKRLIVEVLFTELLILICCFLGKDSIMKNRQPEALHKRTRVNRLRAAEREEDMRWIITQQLLRNHLLR